MVQNRQPTHHVRVLTPANLVRSSASEKSSSPVLPATNDPSRSTADHITLRLQGSPVTMIMLDYCSVWERIRDSGFPAVLGPEHRRCLKSRRLEHHRDRGLAASKLLDPCSRGSFEVKESSTNAHVDVGIICEDQKLLYHYIEYTEGGTSGETVYSHVLIRGPMTQRAFESARRHLADVFGDYTSAVEYSASQNQFILLTDGSGISFNLVSLGTKSKQFELLNGGGIKTALQIILCLKACDFKDKKFGVPLQEDLLVTPALMLLGEERAESPVSETLTSPPPGVTFSKGSKRVLIDDGLEDHISKRVRKSLNYGAPQQSHIQSMDLDEMVAVKGVVER
ncbi:hypothetical protein HK097_010475 [Rhizophlyctis rosea]|uniref:Uncharacterized protein n=1 Tax=Rhizophlyctis rosea TaxID=64517 RepID=A0AAD5SHE3_9FUNG|nr:hypothetical protein HK097_010475 [Rhizophlyctis rosea]